MHQVNYLSDLLILYSPGARGDFLGGFLLNQLTTNQDQIIIPRYLYRKLHDLNGTENPDPWVTIDCVNQFRSVQN
jgi:hypothetical protein